jgi:ribose-phosphate pyrophosphokinase
MLKLFSGTANPKLSEEVSKLLGVPLSKAEVTRFGNSEVKVTIQEEVVNDVCIVIQPTSHPTDSHFMELCFFCDALKRQEARRVIAVVPYFGYAKQNIQHRDGECVSVNVVIRMLESIGFHKVYTFDLHDEATAGVFTIPFRNMTAFDLLATNLATFCESQGIKKEDVALVSPDQGAVEKVRKFGTVFYGSPNFSEVVIEKQRDQNVAHKAAPLDLYGNVQGKVAVIVDDMIVSGSTVVPAVDLCLERGASKVLVVAVHPDFTKDAPERLQSTRFEKLFTTNTIALEDDQRFDKLQVVSIASLIAEELQRFKE